MYQLRISLMGSSPEIWRRFRVSGDIRLDRLHSVIQAVMGWENAHAHEFRSGGKKYTPRQQDLKGEDESRYLLRSIAFQQRFSFLYVYDLGDNWRHAVTVERIDDEAPSLPPKCLKGATACPPENCGGIGGYEDWLKVRKDPKDSNYASAVKLFGRDFEPAAFDCAAVNSRLKRIDWR